MCCYCGIETQPSHVNIKINRIRHTLVSPDTCTKWLKLSIQVELFKQECYNLALDIVDFSKSKGSKLISRSVENKVERSGESWCSKIRAFIVAECLWDLDIYDAFFEGSQFTVWNQERALIIGYEESNWSFTYLREYYLSQCRLRDIWRGPIQQKIIANYLRCYWLDRSWRFWNNMSYESRVYGEDSWGSRTGHSSKYGKIVFTWCVEIG